MSSPEDQVAHYEYGTREYMYWVLPDGTEQRMPVAAYEKSSEARIPSWVFDLFNQPATSVVADWTRVSPTLLSQVLPFQKEGIERGIQLGGRVLLADEMGLGKTIQALGILSYFVSPATAASATVVSTAAALIICPASLTHHWANEVKKWTQYSPFVVSYGKQSLSCTADIIIVSYNLIGTTKSQKWQELTQRPWQCVIVDESHAFRDKETQRTKCLTPLLTTQCEHVILISGTPQLARPCQLYSQLKFLFYDRNGRSFPSWTQFTTRYCNGHISPAFNQWDARGSSCTSELSRLLSQRMIRRLEADVLAQQLPVKTRAKIQVTLDEEEIKHYNATLLEYTTAVQDMRNSTNDTQGARTALFEVKRLKMKLYRETAAAKRNGVVEYIRASSATSARGTIVFFHHQIMLEALLEAFPDAVVIDGSTPAAQRQQFVDQVAKGDKKLALLSLMACCTGLNFTPEVTRVIMAELVFNPSELRQAEARAHRIGAKYPIQIDYLIANQTLDNNILDINMEKFFVTNLTMGDKRSRFDFSSTTTFCSPLYRIGISRFADKMVEYPLAAETQDEFIQRVGVILEQEEALELLRAIEPATTTILPDDKRPNLCEVPPTSSLKLTPTLAVITNLPMAKIKRIQQAAGRRLEMLQEEDAEICGCFTV